MAGMKTKAKRGRGRPPKSDGIDDRIDLRASKAEKQAFQAAADLAGLDRSVWIRQRCRAAAQKELQAAGLPVAFLPN